jgi:hypothetical protein
MKAGDLVRWNATFTSWTDARGVGIVIRVAEPQNLVAVGMVHVHWADGKETKNWYREIEVIDESR